MTEDFARRTSLRVEFDGTDITADITPYLISATFTDNEEDLTDDFTMVLQDRDGIWLSAWLADAISAAAASRKIRAWIIRHGWNGDNRDEELPCGEFELDAVDVSCPPMKVTLRSTSLPYAKQIRQTKHSREWENYNLLAIGMEIGLSAGMLVAPPSSGKNPEYQRVEQYDESDIVFFSRLCKEAGISLKATDGMLVMVDQAEYEAKDAIQTIRYGDGSYISFTLGTGERDTQYSACVVAYYNLETGETFAGTAKNADAKNSQVLNHVAAVSSNAEAEELAGNMLRQKNKFELTAKFTFPGNPSLCACMPLTLAGFGAWDGKYIIKKAVHSVSGTGGYTTQVTLRKGLEG